MKTIWNRVKTIWLHYWEYDEFDPSKKHLSKSDKRSIWYGVFMITAITITVTSIVINLSSTRVAKENADDMKEMMGMISAYIATATEDEYDDITQKLRRDLVIRDFGRNKDYIKYIPNTTDQCRLDMSAFSSQAYLLCNNTGMLYSLDIFDREEDPDSGDKKGTSISFGYDEISETSLVISHTPGEKKGEAHLERGRGIVSIQRMKALFCDDCINQIITATDYGLMPEFVLMDGATKTFYPVEEGELQMGDYNLDIIYSSSSYDISIEYGINGNRKNSALNNS